MITLKSKKELELMRKAGSIVAAAHTKVKEYIKPGVSTKFLDDICEKEILRLGATPSFKGLYDFPCATCISVNDVCQHGRPSNKCILKEGDIISIDIGACYGGYHGDSAWTYPVGKISDEAQRLLDVTEESLYLSLKQVKPGNRIGDISNCICTHLEQNGYSTPGEFTGHGIGKKVHEDPAVPNQGVKGRGTRLVAGMTIAIEPICHMGKPDLIFLSDGMTAVTKDGSIVAHFEHTVAITNSGCVILTK